MEYKTTTLLNEGDLISWHGMIYKTIYIHETFSYHSLHGLQCAKRCDMYSSMKGRCTGVCLRYKPHNVAFKYVCQKVDLPDGSIVYESPVGAFYSRRDMHNHLVKEISLSLR